MDVGSTRELLAVASTDLLCLRWLPENRRMPGSQKGKQRDWSNRTLRSLTRPAMPELITAATRGTHPGSGDQQTEGNPAGGAGAASCDSIYVHHCREIGTLAVHFIHAASCGMLWNWVGYHYCLFISGITSKVMRRRAGRRFNYGASRRRIHRLVLLEIYLTRGNAPDG